MLRHERADQPVDPARARIGIGAREQDADVAPQRVERGQHRAAFAERVVCQRRRMIRHEHVLRARLKPDTVEQRRRATSSVVARMRSRPGLPTQCTCTGSSPSCTTRCARILVGDEMDVRQLGDGVPDRVVESAFGDIPAAQMHDRHSRQQRRRRRGQDLVPVAEQHDQVRSQPAERRANSPAVASPADRAMPIALSSPIAMSTRSAISNPSRPIAASEASSPAARCWPVTISDDLECGSAAQRGERHRQQAPVGAPAGHGRNSAMPGSAKSQHRARRNIDDAPLQAFRDREVHARRGTNTSAAGASASTPDASSGRHRWWPRARRRAPPVDGSSSSSALSQ